ncbi:MAG: O-methyltransferase [Anaerolineae bacterium]|nr:O-methyltransferase [Anaerolineae bacterium]
MAFDPDVTRALVGYVRQWFAPEDDVLAAASRNLLANGLPEAHIRPEEGQMLYFMASLIGARRILELGTLAGYSGIWLARALPADGSLTTLEVNSLHARLAREHFRLAGVADRVEVIEGAALDSLARLDGGEPFDMVFIDADKPNYPAYLDWSVQNVRPGGLITAHNAFRSGQLVDPNSNDAQVEGTRVFLRQMAAHPRLTSTIIPVGDGIAAAVVKWLGNGAAVSGV